MVAALGLAAGDAATGGKAEPGVAAGAPSVAVGDADGSAWTYSASGYGCLRARGPREAISASRRSVNRRPDGVAGTVAPAP